MRSVKVLLVAAVAAFVLTFAFKGNSASAQSSIPACTDKTNFAAITAPLAGTAGTFQDSFNTSMKNASSVTPDALADLIDAGTQARTTVWNLNIDPSKDLGCFALQLQAATVLDDEISLATYLEFVKAGLKNSTAYQTGFTTFQTKIAKDVAIWQALLQMSGGAAGGTAAPTMAATTAASS